VYELRYDLVPVERIHGRLIRNPNYGGPSVGPHGWTWRPEITKASKPEFQEALAADVAENGVRNPILVYAFDDEWLYLTFGGTRVNACKLAGIDRIPALINDYSGHYAASDPVTPENVLSFFTDPPRDYEFGPEGFDYHYNLERARRANHDPAGFAWLDGERPNWIDKEFPWLVPTR